MVGAGMVIEGGAQISNPAALFLQARGSTNARASRYCVLGRNYERVSFLVSMKAPPFHLVPQTL